MSGPPHNFPGNFPMGQQNPNHPMRSQFVGGPQMGNMMGPAQQGMVSPQSYNMGGNVQQSVPSMQQQNPQMSMQMQQQVNKVGPGISPQGQQQVVQQGVCPSGQPGGNHVPNPGAVVAVASSGQEQNQGGPPVPTQKPDINTAALCRYGMEVVQEIVSRMTEVFTLLKALQVHYLLFSEKRFFMDYNVNPPNGTAPGANLCNDRKNKIQELLINIKQNFKRLGMIYQRCNENAQLQGMEYMHIESLIPLRDEWDQKADERKMSESYRMACEERREIMEQVLLKNKHLKEVIDSMRRIIWEINSMLCMRRS
ncbi:Mediator of RNA polymerase II transcription subunit 30 [Frankliniella fusca]|uniref:Mediator of RNA polymerase II transcription subunit 30 n=1 Tax=Frankliniella fusca TaxID=407009 RepID=A0AAE1LQI5_9NEOP|nr:Mediator of RNA polymerase II transcription subunit 30 [Frankliniella fusca]